MPRLALTQKVTISNCIYFVLGGNITDEGRSINLQCIGNKQFESRDTWPECRTPLVCAANDTRPVQTPESITSGLVCEYVDLEEFLSINCTCTDPTKVNICQQLKLKRNSFKSLVKTLFI